ncbi:MAG: single-stranded-DNA-specific exonuclease RecJ [Candidatus Omnitrophota bacterium]
MYKNWQVARVDAHKQTELSKELGISRILASLLINRGLISKTTASSFLNPHLADLVDPFKLKDMANAVKRIKKAQKNKEKVLVIADYDVDGLTSCAVLKSALKRLNLEVFTYLPHRISEGYGISKKALEYCLKIKASLVFTVDCGITGHKEIGFLNKHNIDTIIIDHHQPKGRYLPEAYAIIDPKRPDCAYPYKELAGVGLVYKVVWAFLGHHAKDFFDLVALGTVADIVPLDGENRIFVKEGLRHINFPKRPGIKALLEVCGLKGKIIRTEYINFILGPRINASGRMRTAEDSLELLLTESEEEAFCLAKNLESDNRTRQTVESRVLQEALTKIDKEINFKDHYVIVLSSEGWHQGVLGIVASKVVDRFYRPAIIISLEDNMGKGSARSIHSFHLFEALHKCSKYLEGFGGHKYAAGLTITRDNIDTFKNEMNRIAKDLLRPEDLMPAIDIDAEIRLSDLNKDLILELEKLEPFGKGNPEPIFSVINLYLRGRPLILGRETLKFWVSDGQLFYPAIGFGMAGCLDLICQAQSLDLCFSLRLDSWEGEESLILEVKDIRFNNA